MGTHDRVHIADTLKPLAIPVYDGEPLVHMSSHPMGTGSRASISNTPGCHHQPLLHTRARPKDIHYRASISNTPGGRD